MKTKVSAFIFPILLAAALSVHAQDDFGFGFGFDEEEPEAASGGGGIGSLTGGMSINGKAQAEFFFYAKEFESGDAFRNIRLGDVFSGELNFSAEGSLADGVIKLKLRPDFQDPSRILSLDEAYVRAFLGKRLTVEGGLRKLTWGKADSMGPLDVINPLDYSDLSNMTDLQAIKIARPLLRLSYGIGAFTRIEGVFVPWLQGDRFSQTPGGRWTPAQVADLQNAVYAKFAPQLALLPGYGITNVSFPSIDPSAVSIDTSTLEYAQGGLRFTTTAGSSDIGVQYYSGFFPRPAAVLNERAVTALTGTIMGIVTGSGTAAEKEDAINAALAGLDPKTLFNIAYTRYHQIGVDYARVIAGFNLRGEFAANVTEDLKGTDGHVYNPSLAWSLGFDRDIFAGINVNLQVNETIRLLNSKTGSDPLADIEAGADLTATRLTLVLSKKFLRDELELRATGIWGIEDMDCYILPALIWAKGDITLELSGGIFAGDLKGNLGQYRDNGFFRTVLTYSF
ncbi:MAG: hypothetical protein LBH57_05595 [Treponema sp.]|nr:hypothetical protein [Treponema sp.]